MLFPITVVPRLSFILFNFCVYSSLYFLTSSSRVELVVFISNKFSIHSYFVHKSKIRKKIVLSKRLIDDRSFNSALSLVLIQQIIVTFFSYAIRNYNAMTSKIWKKGNLWRKIFLLEIPLFHFWEDIPVTGNQELQYRTTLYF